MAATPPIKGAYGNEPYCAICEVRGVPLSVIGGRLICAEERCQDRALASAERERRALRQPTLEDLHA